MEKEQLVDWLKTQIDINKKQGKIKKQPEQALYYARAKAFEDVLFELEKAD
ncbi:MAG: hypothetical protein SVY15_04090 [Halobacteriota archaeon]|nr:hypothetical protein [Halobacteriota archaeon]